MAFQYLTNVSLEQARQDYLSQLTQGGFTSRSERVPVPQAAGRVTAAPVYAHISAPHYPASAMDGIALDSKVTFGATETSPVTLNPEDFTVVDTGDPIPANCDAVIMIEDVIWQDDGSARLYAPAVPWQHIRQIGEDICAEEMILASHMAITPSAIGAMLAGGVMEVEVIARPIVGLIPTGDEIVPPTPDPKPGDILEFNSSIFSAMLREWGAQPVVYPIVPDVFAQIQEALKIALDECDIVLINAGSSAGREDFSAQVIGRFGKVIYHGISIKPGKPAILACQGAKPILGIPGYPVSGILVIEQLLKPLLDQWFYRMPAPQVHQMGFLTRPVISSLKYQEFVRVRMGQVGEKLMVSPLNRGSGVISSFMKADGILEVPQGCEGYEAGAAVSVRLLRPLHELKNTLVAIGSHDPLLDEVADLIHQADPSLFMSSTHVGSMGGIMAVRRGETHMAGVHLLDESDGSYNTKFIKKYFPHGGVRLVECVGRTQGLLLEAGNPKEISGVSDLVRPDIRFVNRQKGSGTRILMDYLCKKNGIDQNSIYGYDREEFTHTSVATQIAGGTADAGMGIYSAAKLYHLDFLPICMEQYDLLIPDNAWDTPMVQQLLAVMQSEAFSSRLAVLGGYQVDRPGRVREHF